MLLSNREIQYLICLLANHGLDNEITRRLITKLHSEPGHTDPVINRVESGNNVSSND